MHITEIQRLAAEAWNQTKDAGDPEWADTDLTHCQNLTEVARGVVGGGAATSAFEQAVASAVGGTQPPEVTPDAVPEAPPEIDGAPVANAESEVGQGDVPNPGEPPKAKSKNK